jgi:hypothetical protein
MFTIKLPFHLTECARQHYLRGSRVAEARRLTSKEVVLDGLCISIETLGRSYDVVSDAPPEADSVGLFRGTVWPRYLLALQDGVFIEQQMVLPAEGNAVAISWRLAGPALGPIRLTVNPIFSATEPICEREFQVEPETNGGRLGWRPYPHRSKIIADTNGRDAETELARDCSFYASRNSAHSYLTAPVCFEFELGRQPAVLVFRTELPPGAGVDLLICGFLAEVAEARPADAGYHARGRLAA